MELCCERELSPVKADCTQRPRCLQACLSHHLSSVQGVASRAGATKTKYYLEQVWGGDLTTRTYARADYLSLRRGDQRRALAQLRTGSHWLAEETGRRHGQAREQRVCPHCAAQGQNVLEDPHHMVFSCPLTATCGRGTRSCSKMEREAAGWRRSLPRRPNTGQHRLAGVSDSLLQREAACLPYR